MSVPTIMVFISMNLDNLNRNENQGNADDEGGDDVRQRGEQAEAGFRILRFAVGSMLRLMLFHWIDGLLFWLREFFLRAQEAGEPVV